MGVAEIQEILVSQGMESNKIQCQIIRQGTQFNRRHFTICKLHLKWLWLKLIVIQMNYLMCIGESG